MAQETGNHILMVSHGAASICFYRAFTPKSEWKTGKELGFTNCSALVFDYEAGEFELVDVLTADYSKL